MIEWLFGLAKIYLIGFSIFFILVVGIVIWMFIRVIREMRDFDREWDQRRSRFR